jgi:hypothetical protein
VKAVIEEVSENVFAVDDQRYIQFFSAGKLKPQIERMETKKELVVEVKTLSGGHKVQPVGGTPDTTEPLFATPMKITITFAVIFCLLC